MKRKTIGWPASVSGLVAAAAFGVGILGSGIGSVGSAKASERDDYTGSSGAADAREDLSMGEIVAILSEQGLGEIYEVERESDGYEVEIRDPEGAWLEVHVDAKTGEILDERRDDDRDRESEDDDDRESDDD